MLKPHDPTDLLLSPVALEIDERLEQMAKLDAAALTRQIAWETNMEPRNADEAARAVIASVTYLVDTHGWEVSWDPRGVRLHHENHDMVLGVPRNLVEFVSAAAG
ncbi:hypothetical protein [Sporichthya polymorpha]|uniref:hypothetical protein n=1 Tax=Sporichthya polymorpha TaxID=35751 RepID=UPI000366237A|nr:hypothetical protein [Sporichthya polymorpha]